MTTSIVPTTIPTFSGTSADFPAWQAIFLDACASASGTCTFGKGLLGYALPDAAWIAIRTADGVTPPIATFAGHENPGLPPDLPGPTSTALELSRHSANWTHWTHRNEMYKSQQRDLTAFKVNLISALDPSTLARLTDPVLGTRHLTIRLILADLLTNYGTLTPADISRNEARLRVPYQPAGNLTDYITQQAQAHAIAASNGQGFPEAQKVKYLIDGLGPSNLFQERVTHWQIQLPSVSDQTFALLSVAVKSYDANRDRSATSRTHGYAAPVLASPAQPVVTRIPKQRLPSGSTYCWTHGPDRGHDSALWTTATAKTKPGCRHPSAGHQPTATYTQRLGGTN